MPQSRKFISLVVVIAAAMGSVVGSLVVNHLFFRNSGPLIDKTLMQTASELNKNLPMMVDAETRWDSTISGPGKSIIYLYTLVNLSKDPDFDADEFANILRPTLVNQYRTNDSLKWYRENGISIHYQYSDKNGVFLIELKVGPQDLP